MSDTAQAPEAEPKTDPKSELIEIAKTVAIALLIALLARIFVFQPFTIPSASMEPGLREGDYIVVSKYDYGYSRHSVPLNPPLPHGRLLGAAPKRGDVVVFQLPHKPSITYIKRLVGLPGDRIQVTGGRLIVNGRMLDSTEIGGGVDTGGTPVTQRRETSADGRVFTTFDRGAGRDGDDTGVYTVPTGHYFMMGDNRDNSLDSRWEGPPGVGFVPADNLVGKARMVLFSWRGGASIFKPWTWFTRFDAGRMFRPIR